MENTTIVVLVELGESVKFFHKNESVERLTAGTDWHGCIMY